MKPIIPFALLGALLAVGAADAAVTDPVGYITHTIFPNGGNPSSLTVVGPSLVQATEFAGASTNNPSGLSNITFTGGVPATFDGTYVLEITSGANEGWWSTVSSSNATSITTIDALPAGLAIGTTVSVRKHNTVLTTFGANAPGLTTFGAGTPDEIQFLTPAQGLDSVIYALLSEGAPANGWYFTSDFSSANNAIIEPGTAVLVKNFKATPLTFTSSGTVKLTDTQVDIFPGLTLIGQPAGAGSTMDAIGLQTQLIQFDGVATNFDELQFLDAAQGLTVYAATAPGVIEPFATMGNLTAGAPGGNNIFAEGTGAILKRNTANPAATIKMAGSVVAP